jgi:hypothetical protein
MIQEEVLEGDDVQPFSPSEYRAIADFRQAQRKGPLRSPESEADAYVVNNSCAPSWPIRDFAIRFSVRNGCSTLPAHVNQFGYSCLGLRRRPAE